MQDYNHKARRGTNAFTFTELRIVHVFTVGCLTFAQILLPLQTVNDFLWHHHHWMEWFRPTIEINGFSMVLGSGNHWKRWFSMVFHHWSNDGMVTYHRWSLPQSESASNCAIQRFAFQIHCMSNRVYTVYPIVYTRCVYPIAKRKHYAANINCTICHIAQIFTFTQWMRSIRKIYADMCGIVFLFQIK